MPDIDVGRTAFFFDFDGTLVDIAPEPHLVRVEPAVIHGLAGLSQRTGGAVAVVSGREIAQIDHYLAPLVLPAAGVHGVEIRKPGGRIERADADQLALGEIARIVSAFARPHEGLIVEPKHGSIALHYRRRPELEAACLALAGEVEREGRFHVLRGKMVIEFKASPLTKGTAIADFLAGPPFHGRTAFFAGDDVTDEHGFAAVNRVDGISVKVGAGETAARFRMPDVASLGRWLADMAAEELPDMNALQVDRPTILPRRASG